MAQELVLPQLGLSMDSGRIIRWLNETGDEVAPGQVVLEVESNKATVEVEAPTAGILHVVKGPDDGEIKVGEVIAYLLEEGESPPQGGVAETGVPQASQGTAQSVDAQAASEGDEGRTPRSQGRPPSSPAARRRAEELGVDWRLARGTGPAHRIKARDVERLAASDRDRVRAGAELDQERGEDVRISPVARRLAESVGLDVSQLTRGRPEGRVERADVEAALREAVRLAQSGGGEPRTKTAETRPVEGERHALGQVRRVIAERMSLSAHTAASVTLTTEVDASELVAVREQLKSDPQTAFAPSYNALIAKAVAVALTEHPRVNAMLDGDEVIEWQTVNVGIAVDSDAGLVVPVVHDVQDKSLPRVAREMAGLLERAQAGRATPDELDGGTFTITNLGSFGIDAFTPIINPPESAILGVGRLRDAVVASDGSPVVRTMLSLSLTFDHRVVDGAPAARFLQRVVQLIECPLPWLIQDNSIDG